MSFPSGHGRSGFGGAVVAPIVQGVSLVESSTAWKISPGSAPANWHNQGFDDSSYGPATHKTAGGWYDGTSSRWIWKATPTSNSDLALRTKFTLAAIPSAATLQWAMDNGGEIYLNGVLIVDAPGGRYSNSPSSNYSTVHGVSVDPANFDVGENVLSVAAYNGGIPAGAYLVLSLEGAEDLLTGISPNASRDDHRHDHTDLLNRGASEAHTAVAVSIEDEASNFTSTEVEGALAELAARAWKQPVRAATTAAGTLATSFENADTIDGVVLATGDRILIKDQAAGAANGIYVVAASGAPTRTADFDASSAVLGAAVFVTEGTANADKVFFCTTNAPITLGTTALVFAAISGGGGFAQLAVVIGNGVNVLTTGVKGYISVPFACEIVRARVLADVSGSVVIDVWKDTYANYPPVNADSITASAPPTLASAIKSENTTLTGWTTSLAEGDVIGFNVDSATTVKQVTLELRVQKT